jgi:hypothetical protein
MSEESDRLELQRRLAQARRMATEPTDPLTNERLARLIRDIEEQLVVGDRTDNLRDNA